MKYTLNSNTATGVFMGLGILGIFTFIIFALILGPLLSLWALNTLFGLAIPYTLKTWIAAVIITNILSNRIKTETKKG